MPQQLARAKKPMRKALSILLCTANLAACAYQGASKTFKSEDGNIICHVDGPRIAFTKEAAEAARLALSAVFTIPDIPSPDERTTPKIKPMRKQHTAPETVSIIKACKLLTSR